MRLIPLKKLSTTLAVDCADLSGRLRRGDRLGQIGLHQLRHRRPAHPARRRSSWPATSIEPDKTVMVSVASCSA